MRLSPSFARNAEDRISLCLDAEDRAFLITDELLHNAIHTAVATDDSVIIPMPKGADTVIVPNMSGADLRVQANKCIIDGRYVARFGVGRIGGRRFIVSRGDLEKLPTIDANTNIT
jgi:hypothetical protein